MDYRHASHSKTSLRIHLIFVIKYRKKLLYGSFDENLKRLVFDTCKRYKWNLMEMESDKDHFHMLIVYPPKVSVVQIVSRLKQITTSQMWKRYPGYLANEFWKEHTLWSDGYFAASIGEASTDTIRRYIQNQG